jgi:selenoprotein W-related protein
MADADLVSISIAYCAECGETLRAVRETEDLLAEYEDRIEQITLIPSGNGVYEVKVNGALVFSKTRLGRHPRAGEIIQKVGEKLQR